jgi:serine beta-lactamase-like protein LACTB, mitochondrial
MTLITLKRALIILFLGLFISFNSIIIAQSSNISEKNPKASIENLCHAAIEKDHLPSLSITATKNGKIIFQEAFGFANAEYNTPATPKSMYRIGSISKTLTATLIMSLNEKGLINLNDPIQKYCPEFPEKESTITVAQILSHQSGIRHYSNQHFIEEYYSMIRYASSRDALNVFKNDDLVNTPGTKLSYSSNGYVLLGCAIENITGITFEEALKKYVLIPAGMNQTTLDYFEKLIPYRVNPYEKNKDGSLRNAKSVDLSNKFPAGGILSTAKDLANFGNVLLKNKILNEETLKSMWTPQATNDGKLTGYTLGWRHSSDMTKFFHGGGSAGETAYLYIDKPENIVISFLTNTEDWGEPRHKLAEDIAKVIINSNL